MLTAALAAVNMHDSKSRSGDVLVSQQEALQTKAGTVRVYSESHQSNAQVTLMLAFVIVSRYRCP